MRDILTAATRRPNIGVAILRAAQDCGGIDGLAVPKRSDPARAVDFE
ncbi:MAG: hypothetical protein LBG11_08140 [Bifidobacteriaceae bacterium]|nr:hypothetical protein [Bifidobacteriaceae bacterium]